MYTGHNNNKFGRVFWWRCCCRLAGGQRLVRWQRSFVGALIIMGWGLGRSKQRRHCFSLMEIIVWIAERRVNWEWSASVAWMDHRFPITTPHNWTCRIIKYEFNGNKWEFVIKEWWRRIWWSCQRIGSAREVVCGWLPVWLWCYQLICWSLSQVLTREYVLLTSERICGWRTDGRYKYINPAG